jgi:hypothetical protein
MGGFSPGGAFCSVTMEIPHLFGHTFDVFIGMNTGALKFTCTTVNLQYFSLFLSAE